jgi:hypothetical protein
MKCALRARMFLCFNYERAHPRSQRVTVTLTIFIGILTTSASA